MGRSATPFALAVAAGLGGVVLFAAGCALVEPAPERESVAVESCELRDESEPIRPIPARV